MKLTDATNYMSELSSNLEVIDNLIKDLLSLNNITNQIRVCLDKDDVSLDYYRHSTSFNVSFEKRNHSFSFRRSKKSIIYRINKDKRINCKTIGGKIMKYTQEQIGEMTTTILEIALKREELEDLVAEAQEIIRSTNETYALTSYYRIEERVFKIPRLTLLDFYNEKITNLKSEILSLEKKITRISKIITQKALQI